MQQTLEVIKEKCTTAADTAGERLELFAFKTRAKSRRLRKFLQGRIRVKTFLSRRLDEFNHDHKILFDLIENGDVAVKKDLYNKSKHNIIITLKATRMLTRKQLLSNSVTSDFMYEYLHARRFNPQYKLTVN